MQNRLFSFVLLALFLIPSVAAKESIGPESMLWSMDLFFERLNLWLTFDPAERVRINLAHSDERITEADGAEDDALDKITAQRSIDVTRAQTEFSALKHPEKISAEVKQIVSNQQRAFLPNDAAEEAFFEQDEAWKELLTDVPVVDTNTQTTTYSQTSNQITGAVVVEEVEEEVVEETQPVIETETQTIAQEEEEPTTQALKISAFVQGGEVTRVNITIGDETKKLVLAITDYNATIKEIMKRYNLSYPDVRKAMTWKEE